MKKIILIILILNLTVIAYLTSFNLNAFDEKFYEKEFRKYNVYGEFIDKDIDQINSELILYLRDKEDDYNKELFNAEEIEHLKDVKVLIQKINVFYYLALIIFILLVVALFLLDKKYLFKNLSRILFLSGLLTVFSVLIFLVLAVLDFGNVFTVFHHIFFPGGGWLFNASDNIIKLYPSGFFYDIAKRIFINVIVYGNILILAGVLVFFYGKIKIFPR